MLNAEKIMNIVLKELSDYTEWDDILDKWVNLIICDYVGRNEKLEWIDLKENGYVWKNLFRCEIQIIVLFKFFSFV